MNQMALYLIAASASKDGVPPDLAKALEMILRGIQLLGNGLTLLITHLLAAIGVHVPQIAIQIGTIILVTLLLWRLGNAVSKVVLYALIFLLISLFAGLIPTIAQYFVPNPPQT